MIIEFLNFFAVWTYWGVNWFFLPNPIFAICLNFQQQNSLKNQYLQQLSSDFFEINSIKPGFWRAFQEHQECFQIPIKFSILILFSFHWENGSIINSFHTIAPNSLRPSWCTPTNWQLSEERSMKDCGLEDLSMTKQNKLPCLLHRYQFVGCWV